MRAAPAIEAALDDAALLRRLTADLHLLAGAACGAWLGQLLELPGLPATLLPAGLAWALGHGQARRLWPPGAAGRLRWDGQGWTGPDGPCALQVMFDLGDWRLLHLRGVATASRWCLATARAAGPDWPLLAVALRAHGRSRDPAAEA
ncbi:MAG: hypothetical protein KBC73_16390 [Burkholderiaceae bacterium]|nr:hypothetical protein [Burkholderiaceae bacterium]